MPSPDFSPLLDKLVDKMVSEGHIPSEQFVTDSDQYNTTLQHLTASGSNLLSSVTGKALNQKQQQLLRSALARRLNTTSQEQTQYQVPEGERKAGVANAFASTIQDNLLRTGQLVSLPLAAVGQIPGLGVLAEPFYAASDALARNDAIRNEMLASGELGTAANITGTIAGTVLDPMMLAPMKAAEATATGIRLGKSLASTAGRTKALAANLALSGAVATEQAASRSHDRVSAEGRKEVEAERDATIDLSKRHILDDWLAAHQTPGRIAARSLLEGLVSVAPSALLAGSGGIYRPLGQALHEGTGWGGLAKQTAIGALEEGVAGAGQELAHQMLTKDAPLDAGNILLEGAMSAPVGGLFAAGMNAPHTLAKQPPTTGGKGIKEPIPPEVRLQRIDAQLVQATDPTVIAQLKAAKETLMVQQAIAQHKEALDAATTPPEDVAATTPVAEEASAPEQAKPQAASAGDALVGKPVDTPANEESAGAVLAGKIKKRLAEAKAAPAPRALPTAQLPFRLSRAAPRYKKDTTSFASDLDKAAYIISNSRGQRSPHDAEYLAFVMDNTGLSESQARAYGDAVDRALGKVKPVKGHRKAPPVWTENQAAAQPTAAEAIAPTPTPAPKKAKAPAVQEPAKADDQGTIAFGEAPAGTETVAPPPVTADGEQGTIPFGEPTTDTAPVVSSEPAADTNPAVVEATTDTNPVVDSEPAVQATQTKKAKIAAKNKKGKKAEPEAVEPEPVTQQAEQVKPEPEPVTQPAEPESVAEKAKIAEQPEPASEQTANKRGAVVPELADKQQVKVSKIKEGKIKQEATVRGETIPVDKGVLAVVEAEGKFYVVRNTREGGLTVATPKGSAPQAGRTKERLPAFATEAEARAAMEEAATRVARTRRSSAEVQQAKEAGKPAFVGEGMQTRSVDPSLRERGDTGPSDTTVAQLEDIRNELRNPNKSPKDVASALSRAHKAWEKQLDVFDVPDASKEAAKAAVALLPDTPEAVQTLIELSSKNGEKDLADALTARAKATAGEATPQVEASSTNRVANVTRTVDTSLPKTEAPEVLLDNALAELGVPADIHRQVIKAKTAAELQAAAKEIELHAETLTGPDQAKAELLAESLALQAEAAKPKRNNSRKGSTSLFADIADAGFRGMQWLADALYAAGGKGINWGKVLGHAVTNKIAGPRVGTSHGWEALNWLNKAGDGIAHWFTLPETLARRLPDAAPIIDRVREHDARMHAANVELAMIAEPLLELNAASQAKLNDIVEHRMEALNRGQAWIDSTGKTYTSRSGKSYTLTEAELAGLKALDALSKTMRDNSLARVFAAFGLKEVPFDGLPKWIKRVADEAANTPFPEPELQTKIEAANLISGMVGSLLPGYVPLRRFGTFHVVVRDSKKDKIVYRAAATSAREQAKLVQVAKQWVQDQGLGASAKVEALPESRPMQGKPADRLADVRGALEDLGLELPEGFDDAFKRKNAPFTANKYTLRRSGVPGYDTNFIRAVVEGSLSTKGALERTRFTADTEQVRQALAERIANNEVDPGNLGAYNSYMDTFWKTSAGPAERLTDGIRALAALNTIGFNATTAVLNPVSTSINAMSLASQLRGKTISSVWLAASRSFSGAALQLTGGKFSSPAKKRAYLAARERGEVTDIRNTGLTQASVGEEPGAARTVLSNSLWLFAKSDTYARTLAWSMGYDMATKGATASFWNRAKDLGYRGSQTDPSEFAAWFAARSNHRYGKQERIAVANTPVLGAAFSLSDFTISQVSLIKDLFRVAAKHSDARGIATLLGTLSLLTGLPAGLSMEWLTDLLPESKKQAVEQSIHDRFGMLGDIATGGVLKTFGGGAGEAFAKRISVNPLFTDTAEKGLVALGGVPASLIAQRSKHAAQAYQHFAGDRLQPQLGFVSLTRALAPNVIGKLLQVAQEGEEGAGPQTVSRRAIHPESIEHNKRRVALGTLGLTDSTASTVASLQYEATQAGSDSKRGFLRSLLPDMINRGIKVSEAGELDIDEAVLDKAITEIEDWNNSHPDDIDQITKRDVTARLMKGAQDRLLSVRKYTTANSVEREHILQQARQVLARAGLGFEDELGLDNSSD